jgi:hypothetical protein
LLIPETAWVLARFNKPEIGRAAPELWAYFSIPFKAVGKVGKDGI